MIYAQKRAKHKSFLDSIRGALFFGVPSQGMDVESLIQIVRNQPNEELLRSLGPHSKVLRDQSRAFKDAFRQSLPIAYFYECQTSPTARKVSTIMLEFLNYFGGGANWSK